MSDFSATGRPMPGPDDDAPAGEPGVVMQWQDGELIRLIEGQAEGQAEGDAGQAEGRRARLELSAGPIPITWPGYKGNTDRPDSAECSSASDAGRALELELLGALTRAHRAAAQRHLAGAALHLAAAGDQSVATLAELLRELSRAAGDQSVATLAEAQALELAGGQLIALALAALELGDSLAAIGAGAPFHLAAAMGREASTIAGAVPRLAEILHLARRYQGAPRPNRPCGFCLEPCAYCDQG